MALNTLKLVIKLTCTETALEIHTNGYVGLDVDMTTLAVKTISSIDLLSNDLGIRINTLVGTPYTLTKEDISIVGNDHTTSYDPENGKLDSHSKIKHILDAFCGFTDPGVGCH